MSLMDEVVAQLAQASAQGDEPVLLEHPIHPVAQAMELTDRFRRATNAAPLAPGMLCREKRGMGVLRRNPVVMLWRWLDPADVVDREMLKAYMIKHVSNRADCVIGFLDQDGELVIHVGESWRMQPASEADLAAWSVRDTPAPSE